MFVNTLEIGTIVASYKRIPVYENGIMFFRSQGKHYAPDGYYYGQKWQCVEFVKRFYKQFFAHEMPDVWGHARSFFDQSIDDFGGLNKKRGLFQYNNGGFVAPKVNDILVFTDTQYGHVGIIKAVNANSVEIIQQNIFAKPIQMFKLEQKKQRYFISSPRQAQAWLRLP